MICALTDKGREVAKKVKKAYQTVEQNIKLAGDKNPFSNFNALQALLLNKGQPDEVMFKRET